MTGLTSEELDICQEALKDRYLLDRYEEVLSRLDEIEERLNSIESKWDVV